MSPSDPDLLVQLGPTWTLNRSLFTDYLVQVSQLHKPRLSQLEACLGARPQICGSLSGPLGARGSIGNATAGGTFGCADLQRYTRILSVWVAAERSSPLK